MDKPTSERVMSKVGVTLKEYLREMWQASPQGFEAMSEQVCEWFRELEADRDDAVADRGMMAVVMDEHVRYCKLDTMNVRAAKRTLYTWEQVREMLIDCADEVEELCLATSNLDYEAIADAIRDTGRRHRPGEAQVADPTRPLDDTGHRTSSRTETGGDVLPQTFEQERVDAAEERDANRMIQVAKAEERIRELERERDEALRELEQLVRRLHHDRLLTPEQVREKMLEHWKRCKGYVFYKEQFEAAERAADAILEQERKG